MTVRRCRFVGEHFSVELLLFFVLIRLHFIDLRLQSKSFRSQPTKQIAYIGENKLGVKRMKTSNSRRTVPLPPPCAALSWNTVICVSCTAMAA